MGFQNHHHHTALIKDDDMVVIVAAMLHETNGDNVKVEQLIGLGKGRQNLKLGQNH